MVSETSIEVALVEMMIFQRNETGTITSFVTKVFFCLQRRNGTEVFEEVIPGYPKTRLVYS
jgi:hypothetical protein